LKAERSHIEVIFQMADPRAEIWDCVVVGAGVVGSWAAYHLTKNGKKTLLIDQVHKGVNFDVHGSLFLVQFALPHTRGSSHGQSRIIRNSYVEPHYVQIMPESFDLWAQLERESGKTLFR
jgi:sarcosine oxidase/L-pipecolate oxidase